jgi:lysozyme family protein
MPAYNPQLQSEYQRLFDTCTIRPDKYREVDAIINTILKGRSVYEKLQQRLHIPWQFIGIIHCMEGSCNFKVHLHNGDPLSARTVQVPVGRPKFGNPPFTWEMSAEDAMILKKFNNISDWSVPAMLFRFEGYNGFGYRKVGINMPSPYVWSFSNHYTKGKFVSDGKFNSNAISKQCGAGVLLRRFFEKQIAKEDMIDRIGLIKQLGAQVNYEPNRYSAKAEELQKLLNAHGALLKIDGKAGRNTSDAYFKITGQFLASDPLVDGS